MQTFFIIYDLRDDHPNYQQIMNLLASWDAHRTLASDSVWMLNNTESRNCAYFVSELKQYTGNDNLIVVEAEKFYSNDQIG